MNLPALSDCDPGLECLEYNVLIAPEEVSAITKGGIILPDKERETEALAVVRGVLVDASPLAFNYDAWPDGERQPPRPGDHVYYAKYGGTLVTGADGREYRLMKDKDVSARIKEKPNV